MITQEKNSNDSHNSSNFIAKKSLGQNFLHAPHVANVMIHAAHIGHDSVVLEVGPGKGALTEKIISAKARVVAIEKDDRAMAFLQEKFAEHTKTGQLKLIHGDILDFDPENRDMKNNRLTGVNELICGEYIIAANIPYYITGEFLRKFLESPCQPKRMVLMVQKEVAKRITVNTHDTHIADSKKSHRKSEKESILSISVKTYGEPSYITTVPARYFRPVPNVDSAVLLIDNISKKFFNTDIATLDEAHHNQYKQFEKYFFSVVKAGFAHKRKVLIKNLENIGFSRFSREILEKMWQERGLSPKIRAEELTLDDWKAITIALTNSFPHLTLK
jgi:16S rRNA (adenine1518-N6/adenine1519-N6)-dimethyltransferase